ncbi:hypothetical protein ACFFX0_10640 [Citricoccus parietis]|uniref:Uncharacterized protein n=1 Tax=Citricoccus parietis TaxID=592307 RepID=A0ABV5FY84_9MICC
MEPSRPRARAADPVPELGTVEVESWVLSIVHASKRRWRPRPSSRSP